MKGYLLDTNVLSEVRKGERARASVAAWFDGLEEESIFISVLAIGEIRRGIELARKTDPAKANILDGWLNGLVRYYGSRILAVDERIAERWGRLSLDQKLPDVDGLLAATALVHDLMLATRNVADFKRSGVRLFDPFIVR
ncbi:type II toxin-antitoxin system VapC family toxin [soil metagenome]